MTHHVHVRNGDVRIYAEYRNGPEVTCECEAIKAPDGWIVDQIRVTPPSSARRGYASAIIRRLVEISGMPVRVLAIGPGPAEHFWRQMRQLGLCAPSCEKTDDHG